MTDPTPSTATGLWRVWIDTGGTFTDCVAVDPEGRLHRAKVLSSSALRCRAAERVGERRLRLRAPWRLPGGFLDGAELRWLERRGEPLRVVASGADWLEAGEPLPGDLERGETVELRFDQEAPILAARLVAAEAGHRSQDLPPMALRLATTRGTNALLERRGARTVFFITRGFADLLQIGNQQRPDLFALDVRRPEPFYERVVEVPERLAADGTVLEPLEVSNLSETIDELLAAGIESAAVALLHGYRAPEHEAALAAELRRRGFGHVSSSAALAPVVKIVPRAETAVVDAYLSPVIDRYLRRVEGALTSGSSLHVMTSAGGLVRSDRYHPKDSLLSGPAGGVVGAARCGVEEGWRRVIAFDMGGTSTDVARFDGDHEYLFEHRVGDATVAAPALAIESVAAGGGSICHAEGAQVKVGPASAGADPGPACYGAGGPLTLTDVNLLLGRLEPSRFGIPIVREAAAAALGALEARLAEHGSELAREELLRGLLRIADERMADAVRRISVRRGYDPRGYALVAFGGAGGQHAASVAELLGVRTLLVPREAGLLSALGLGAAVVERFAHRQLLRPLDEVGGELATTLAELEEQARGEVASEGVAAEELMIRRRLAFLRFAGQESTLELELGDGGAGEAADEELGRAFRDRYRELYGYRPPERPIEVEAVRVVVSSRPEPLPESAPEPPPRDAEPVGEQRAFFDGWRPVPVFAGPELRPGDRLDGPALVLDDYATLVVDAGWRARVSARGTVVVERGKG